VSPGADVRARRGFEVFTVGWLDVGLGAITADAADERADQLPQTE